MSGSVFGKVFSDENFVWVVFQAPLVVGVHVRSLRFILILFCFPFLPYNVVNIVIFLNIHIS
jgi:hypothetical protein